MTERIRIWVDRGGRSGKCINTSRETVGIRFSGTPEWLVARPYTKIEGSYEKHAKADLPDAPKTVRQDFSDLPYPGYVRRAVEEDIGALMAFVPTIIAELSLLPVSEEKVERLIERCVLRQGGAIAGVIDGEDGIDASVGLVFATSEVSDIPFVRAVWLGLNPEATRLRPDQKGPRAHLARMLFEFAEWCHAGLEVNTGHPVLLQFDIATKTALGAKIGLYQRSAEQVGVTFAYGAREGFLAQAAEQVETV